MVFDQAYQSRHIQQYILVVVLEQLLQLGLKLPVVLRKVLVVESDEVLLVHHDRLIGFGSFQSLVTSEGVQELFVHFLAFDDALCHVVGLLGVVVLLVEILGVAEVLDVLEEPASGEVGVHQNTLMAVISVGIQSQQDG